MLTNKQRKILSLIILLVWLPAYIIIVLNLINFLDRPSIVIELLIYVIAGILWALPFKFIFKGIGKSEKDS
ncbi:hypothetical protein CBE37_04285 [bacterium TMED277]|nr:MAG: hypothetical protein CBE37_04285 [bacterium TMED277]